MAGNTHQRHRPKAAELRTQVTSHECTTSTYYSHKVVVPICRMIYNSICWEKYTSCLTSVDSSAHCPDCQRKARERTCNRVRPYNDRISDILITAQTTASITTITIHITTISTKQVMKCHTETAGSRMCTKLQFNKCKQNFYSNATITHAKKLPHTKLRRYRNGSVAGKEQPSKLVRTRSVIRSQQPGYDLVRTTRTQWLGNHSRSCQLIVTVVTVVSKQGRVHHTRLYSLRFSWSIVSLTAAKTKRMFSVSTKTDDTYYIKATRFKFTSWMVPEIR